MAHYKATVTTTEGREAVFDYLADFRSAVEWDPATREVSLQRGEPGRPGSEFRLVSRFMGRDIALTYRTVEVDRPRRIVLVAEASAATSRDEITFTEVADGGTAVTYSAELRLRGPLRLLDPVLSVFFSRLGENARRQMARRLAGPLGRERSEAAA
jgi:uncharacterized protein YndB with AHSA1/START domain